jgi:hypothetical protein
LTKGGRHALLGHPSPEQTIMRLVKRAKLFVFLRQHRHEHFDDASRPSSSRLNSP